MYTLIFSPQAIEDLSKLKKSEPVAFMKAGKLLAESVVNVDVLSAYGHYDD